MLTCFLCASVICWVVAVVGQHGLDWVISYPASQLGPPREFCRIATPVYETTRCLSAAVSPWLHGRDVSMHHGLVRYAGQMFPSNYCEAKYPGCVTRPSRCVTNCSRFETSYLGYSCFCDDVVYESMHGEHLITEGITAVCQVDNCTNTPTCDAPVNIPINASIRNTAQNMVQLTVPHRRLSDARLMYTLTFTDPYPTMIRIVQLDDYCLYGFVEDMYVEHTPAAIAFTFSTSLAFSVIGFTVDNTTLWDGVMPTFQQGPCFACECATGFGRDASPLCQYAEPVIGECTVDQSCKHQPPHFLTKFSAIVQQTHDSSMGSNAPWFTIIPAIPAGSSVTVVVKSMDGIYAAGKSGQRVSLLMDGMNNMYKPVTVNGPGRRLEYVRRGAAVGNATQGIVQFEVRGVFVLPDQMYYVDYAAMEAGCKMSVQAGNAVIRVTPHVPGTYTCTLTPSVGSTGVSAIQRHVAFGVWTEVAFHRVLQYFGAGIGDVTLWVNGKSTAKVWYDFITGDDCIITQRVLQSPGTSVSPYFAALFADKPFASPLCLQYPANMTLSNRSDFVIEGTVAAGSPVIAGCNFTSIACDPEFLAIWNTMCVTSNICDILLGTKGSVQTFVSNTYAGVHCNGQNRDADFLNTTRNNMTDFAVPRKPTAASLPVSVSPYSITYLLNDVIYASTSCLAYPNTSVLLTDSDFRLVGGVAVKRDQQEMCVAANACDIILQAEGSIQTFVLSSTYIGILCNDQNYDILFTSAKMSIIVPRVTCEGTSLPGVYPPVPGWDVMTLDAVSGMLLSGVYTHTASTAGVLVTGIRRGVELVTYPWKDVFVRVNQTWWMCGSSKLVDGGTLIFTHAIPGWSYELGILHGKQYKANETTVLSYQVGCGNDCSVYCNSSTASIIGCGIRSIQQLNNSHLRLTGPGTFVVQTGGESENTIKGSCNVNKSVPVSVLSPARINSALAFALTLPSPISTATEGAILSLKGMVPKGNPLLQACGTLPLGGTTLYRPVSVTCAANTTTGKTDICTSIQGCVAGNESPFMVNGGCYGCGTNTTLTSTYQPFIYGLLNKFPYGAIIPTSDSGFVAALQSMFIRCIKYEASGEPVIIVLDATCDSGFRCVVYAATSVTGTVVGKSGRCMPAPNAAALGPYSAAVTRMATGEVGDVVLTSGAAVVLAVADVDQCPFYAGLVSPCHLDIGQSVTVVAGQDVPYPLGDYLDCTTVHIPASETAATTHQFLQFVDLARDRFPLSGSSDVDYTVSGKGGFGSAAGPGMNNISNIKAAILAFLPGLQQNVGNMSTYLSASGAIAAFVAGIKAEYTTRGRGTTNYQGMDFLLRASSMINLYFALRGNNTSAPNTTTVSRGANEVYLGFNAIYPGDLWNATVQPQPGFSAVEDDAACVYDCCTGGGWGKCTEWRCDVRWNFNLWRYYYLRYLWISGRKDPPLDWREVTNSRNGRRDNFPPNAQPPFDWMHGGVAHIANMVMDDASMNCNRLDPRWFGVTVNVSWPGLFQNFLTESIMSIAQECYRFTNPTLFQYSYVLDSNCLTYDDHSKSTVYPISIGQFDPSCNYYEDSGKSPGTYRTPRVVGQKATQPDIIPPGFPPTAAGNVYFSPGMAPLATCTDLDVMAYAYPFSLKYPLAMTTVLHALFYLSAPDGTLIDDSVIPPVASAQAYVELAVMATMECNGYGDIMAAHDLAEARLDTPKIDICLSPPVSMHASDGSSPACAILYSQLVSNICGGDTFTLMGRWNASLNITSQMLDAGCSQDDYMRSSTSFLGDPSKGLFVGVPDMGCGSSIQCVPIPSPFGTDPMQYIRWGLVAFFYRMIALQGVFDDDDAINVADFAELLFPPPVALVIPPISSRPSQCYVPNINSTLFVKSVAAEGVVVANVGDFATSNISFISVGDVTIQCA